MYNSKTRSGNQCTPKTYITIQANHTSEQWYPSSSWTRSSTALSCLWELWMLARYKYVRPLDLYRSAVNIWPAITHRAVSWWSGLVSDGALAVHTLLMGCSAHIQFHAKRFRTKFKTSFIHTQHHHFCFLLCTTDHHPHSIRDLLFYRRRPNDPFHSNVMLCCITTPCLLSIHPSNYTLQ